MMGNVGGPGGKFFGRCPTESSLAMTSAVIVTPKTETKDNILR